MQNKKISFLLPSLNGGGAERVLLNLANYYAKKDLDVDLVLVKAKGAFIGQIDEKVSLINLNQNRVFKSLFVLIEYIRHSQPDTMLVTMPHISLIAILAKWLSKSSMRLIIRQPNYLTLNVSKNSWLTKIYLNLACFLFNYSNEVIAISQGVADDLKRYNLIKEEKIKVIYNPVLLSEVQEKSNHIIDHAWFSRKKCPIILGIGRLVKQKNFSLLISAFAKVREQKEIKLVILGEGEQKKRLLELVNRYGISEHVDLPGFVDNPYPYLKQADLFVLSSLWEGFGNVLIESLVLGTSIVSTNCLSGPAEILKNEKYGKLVPINDAEALAKAIIDTIEHPLDKKALINRGRDFLIENIATEYQKVIFGDQKR